MNAIQCLVASLLGKRKIEAYKSGSLLSAAELKSNLLNTRGYDNLSFEPLKDIPPDVLRKWKDFFSDFFGQPPETNPARLLDAIKAAFNALFVEIQQYQVHHARYPFVERITSRQEEMERISKSGRDYFLGDFLTEAEDLVNWKEQHLTPFRNFLSSPQKAIYDEISGFLMDKSGELPKEVRQQLLDGLQDPDFLLKQQLPVLKQVYEKIKSDHAAELMSRREDYLSLLEQKKHDISAMTGSNS